MLAIQVYQLFICTVHRMNRHYFWFAGFYFLSTMLLQW